MCFHFQSTFPGVKKKPVDYTLISSAFTLACLLLVAGMSNRTLSKTSERQLSLTTLPLNVYTELQYGVIHLWHPQKRVHFSAPTPIYSHPFWSYFLTNIKCGRPNFCVPPPTQPPPCPSPYNCVIGFPWNIDVTNSKTPLLLLIFAKTSLYVLYVIVA